MPCAPLTSPANRPDKLLPFATLKNQPPIARPAQRGGASLVVIDKPIGDKQSWPSDGSTYTAASVQNGIFGCASSRCANANISSRNAAPLNSMPLPNLNGIEGRRPILPSHTQHAATKGASAIT